ncbi:hypothetical protein BESB_004940 [Besnoitia besnoiti]|uniref:Uncharacterized protein n=1 Tax=Besnoitia besnoiti TaxID=94643 RepID=A0A2A9MPW0_BESBE|nr:hypothetical protein BESB_004940 [Besnoitia besnoiti]PFH38153.1 hypothetical protein BESB_004940 [Besnoitia besnoiti]
MASLLHSFILSTEGTCVGDAAFSLLAKLGGAKLGLEKNLTTTLFYLRHPELLQQFMTEWTATQILGSPSPDVERHLHAMHCHRTVRLRHQRTLADLETVCTTAGLREPTASSAVGFSHANRTPGSGVFRSHSSIHSETDTWLEAEGLGFEDVGAEHRVTDSSSVTEAEKFLQTLPPEFTELLQASGGSVLTAGSSPAWRMPDGDEQGGFFGDDQYEQCSAFDGGQAAAAFSPLPAYPPEAAEEDQEKASTFVPRSKMEFFEHQLQILSDFLVDVEQTDKKLDGFLEEAETHGQEGEEA